MTRSYVTTARLDEIRLALSARDLAVLRTLAAYQIATGDQLRRLHYTTHATQPAAARAARHGLARLAKLGVIDHLNRRIGGIRAGSTGYAWHLSRTGHRLLAHLDGRAIVGRIAMAEPSLRRLDHTLTITEVGVQLHEAAHAGHLDLIEVTPEPASWRTYLSAGGGRLTLKPDLFAVTAKPGADTEDLWFIEVDRATESPNTITRKAAQYQAYRQTGIEQTTQGTFPKIVWIVPDQARADRITDALASAPRIDPTGHIAMTLDALCPGSQSHPSTGVHL